MLGLVCADERWILLPDAFRQCYEAYTIYSFYRFLHGARPSPHPSPAPPAPCAPHERRASSALTASALLERRVRCVHSNAIFERWLTVRPRRRGGGGGSAAYIEDTEGRSVLDVLRTKPPMRHLFPLRLAVWTPHGRAPPRTAAHRRRVARRVAP